MRPDELARILRDVPEVRLRLLEMARELTREDGTVDMEKATFLSKELEDAIHEAAAYSQATREMVWVLKRLDQARS